MKDKQKKLIRQLDKAISRLATIKDKPTALRLALRRAFGIMRQMENYITKEYPLVKKVKLKKVSIRTIAEKLQRRAVRLLNSIAMMEGVNSRLGNGDFLLPLNQNNVVYYAGYLISATNDYIKTNYGDKIQKFLNKNRALNFEYSLLKGTK